MKACWGGLGASQVVDAMADLGFGVWDITRLQAMLIAVQVLPLSSLRNDPADEIAVMIALVSSDPG